MLDPVRPGSWIGEETNRQTSRRNASILIFPVVMRESDDLRRAREMYGSLSQVWGE